MKGTVGANDRMRSVDTDVEKVAVGLKPEVLKTRKRLGGKKGEEVARRKFAPKGGQIPSLTQFKVKTWTDPQTGSGDASQPRV